MRFRILDSRIWNASRPLRNGRVRERQIAEKELSARLRRLLVADPNRVLFEAVVRLLVPILDELVLVGRRRRRPSGDC